MFCVQQLRNRKSYLTWNHLKPAIFTNASMTTNYIQYPYIIRNGNLIHNKNKDNKLKPLFANLAWICRCSLGWYFNYTKQNYDYLLYDLKWESQIKYSTIIPHAVHCFRIMNNNSNRVVYRQRYSSLLLICSYFASVLIYIFLFSCRK